MSDQAHTSTEDELRALEAQGVENARRVQLILSLTEEYLIDSPQRAVEQLTAAVAIARRIGDARGLGMSLGYLGWAKSGLSDFESALSHLHEAKTILSESEEQHGYARVLMALANVHRSLGNTELSYETGLEALRRFREIGDIVNEGWILYGLAGGHSDAGDWDLALENHNQALCLFAEAEHTLGDQRAVMGRARALNGIGGIYHLRGQYELALMYHRDSLDIFRTRNAPLGEARALDDLGATYQRLGEFQCALECHTDSLHLRERVGNRQAQCTSLINLGTLYTRMDDTAKALEALHRALAIAQEVKSRPKEFQVHEALSSAYQKLGELDKALEHHERFHEIRDEVVGDQTKARMRNLQVAFAVESAEQRAEIERLRNVELKETNERLEQLLNELTETQMQLIQTEKMASLGQLVSSLVHELNTPLGVVESAFDTYDRGLSSLTDALETATSLQDLQGNERLARVLNVMRESRSLSSDAVDRISRLVHSLKSFARLDQAAIQHVDIHVGLKDTLTLLEPEFGDRIRVTRNFTTCPPITCNPGELNQVFMNLLSNAVQAIQAEGTIEVRTFPDDGHVMVEISDSGMGIPAEQIRQLFDPGFSKRGSRIKAGLGLFTSYNIVQKHGGDIRVESRVGQGTTFRISLPVRRPPSIS